MNYIYGTWQVLRGLALHRRGHDARRTSAAPSRWLLAHQNRDGGWGESIASYDDPAEAGVGRLDAQPDRLGDAWASSPPGEARQHRRSGAASATCSTRQDADGTWAQDAWTGTGFPRVFYLNYHLYRHYFPLMALAQYRRATAMSELAKRG